jgi:aspartate racemase
MAAPQHIGIVACSAEGASLCYRTICADAEALLGTHAHPELSLHSLSLADYVDCLERGDLQGVAGLMLRSAHKLAAAGADFLICPDNTIHQALPLVLPHSPLPWLHIAEVVAAEAARRGFRKVGLTGTRWLVDSGVYPDALAAARCRARRHRRGHHGAAGERGLSPRRRGAVPVGVRPHARGWLRCRHPRLHRNPFAHE